MVPAFQILKDGFTYTFPTMDHTSLLRKDHLKMLMTYLLSNGKTCRGPAI